MKSFDAQEAQDRAWEFYDVMYGKSYEHWKGGIYIVRDVVVSEATGEPVVIYTSDEKQYFWMRTFADFTETVFVKNGGTVKARPRFAECETEGPKKTFMPMTIFVPLVAIGALLAAAAWHVMGLCVFKP